MDKSLNRGMCIKFESHKICVAGNQCDNSNFDLHNAEHKELPVIRISRSTKRRLSTIKTKRDSGLFGYYCDSCDNSSYSFNFV